VLGDETLPQAPATPPVIRYVGDYELIEEIGRGGAGVVYRARQRSLGREVAVKLLRAGELATAAEVERFRREARAAAGLDHPGVVPLYEVGEADGLHYYSMRLVPGPSLAAVLEAAPCGSPSRPSPGEFARIVAAVAHAVDHAHRNGIVHRDLKPGNILLEPDVSGVPVVTDFGLARRLAPGDAASLTPTGALVGTPRYLAPELTRGEEALPSSDVYALGVVLYECLVGHPPFPAGGGEVPVVELVRQIEAGNPPPPRLGRRLRDLETICLKCLERDPAARYPSAAGLADDLEAWREDRPIAARPAGRVRRLRLWAARQPAVARLTAAVVFLAIGAAVAAGVYLIRPLAPSETVAPPRAGQPQAEPADAKARAEQEVREREARRVSEEARRRQYLQDLPLVADALLRDDAGRARQLLDRHIPAAGQDDHRRWEWGYLDNCARAAPRVVYRESLIEGRRASVTASPDGRWAAAVHDGILILLDLPAGKRAGLLKQEIFGEPAFTAGESALWVAENGRQVLRAVPSLEPIRSFPTRDRNIRNVCPGPDGKRVALVTDRQTPDQNTELIVTDEKDREVCRITEFPRRTAFLSKVLWSPNGKRIATCQEDTTQVWDPVSGKQMFRVPGASVPVSWGAVPDQLLLVKNGDRHRALGAEVWDVAAGNRLHGLLGLPGSVGDNSLAREGSRWAVAGARVRIPGRDASGVDVVFVWDANTGSLIAVEPPRPAAPGTRVAVKDDKGLRIVELGIAPASEVTVRVDPYARGDLAWRSATELGIGGGPNAAAWSAKDGSVRALGGNWPRPFGDPLANVPGPVSWRADGRRFACEGILWTPGPGGTGSRVALDYTGVVDRPRLGPWSPDGKRILATYNRYRVNWLGIWNTDTGALVRKFAINDSPDWGDSTPPAWSPDGDRVATRAGSEFRVWEASTGRLLQELRGDPNAFIGTTAISWAPGGRHLALVGGTVTVWDLAKGKVSAGYKHENNGGSPNYQATWSPDGKLLALTAKWEVVLLDAGSGEVLHRLVGEALGGAPGTREGGEVGVAAWSPDGSRLAVIGHQQGDPDRQVAVWDTKTGTRVSVYRSTNEARLSAYWVAWDPKGERIAVEVYSKSAKRIGVLDAVNCKEVESPAGAARWWNPDDPALTTFRWSDSKGTTVLVRGERELLPGPSDPWFALQSGQTVLASPDGSRAFWLPLEWSSGHPDHKEGQPLSPRILDASDGRTLVRLEEPGFRIATMPPGVGSVVAGSGAAWSPDGTRIAGAARDGQVVVWDAANGKALLRSRPRIVGDEPAPPYFTLAWSLDGRRLAFAPANVRGEIGFLDAADGKELARFPGPPGGVTSLAWSPDGKRLAAGANDRTARVWGADGREELVLRGHASRVTCVGWHPDGSRLATAEYNSQKPESVAGEVRVWDAVTGQRLLTLGGCVQVAWSPDGLRLATQHRTVDYPSDLEKDRYGNARPAATVWDAGPSKER
jgi:WD40 repeat protein/tRNA A-37 threonylcarbamoyl transferase component Bud32